MTQADAPPLRRRDAMAMLGSLAALGPAFAAWGTPALAQPVLDRAAFLAASSLATGLPADALTGLTDALLPVFQAQGPALLQLAALARAAAPADLAAAIRGTPMEPAAKALAAAWYTGTVGTTLLSYEDALAWKAAGYEAVPSQCAGEFGLWAEPPASL